MRDEDETFADIVKHEFDEQWSPAPNPAPSPAPIPSASQPLPDFHLNLYDDEESYREVPRAAWRMSRTTSWGLGLIILGVLIAAAKIAPLGLPLWVGWIAVACFIGGAFLCLWYVTHAKTESDDEGTV